MTPCVDHGRVSSSGYTKGHARHGFRNVGLHRQVFFLTHGYLPPVVRHTCDNPRCINPEHLAGGTTADNMRDKVERGRSPKAQPTKRRLTMEQAAAIRERWEKKTGEYGDPNGARAIAKTYGVAPCAVYNIVRGVTYVA